VKAQTGSSDSSQSASSGSSQSGSADSSPQDQSSSGPQPVYTHPENNPTLGFLDEVTANNYVKLGLGASMGYDTNAAFFSVPSYSQTQGIFTASLQLTQTRRKVAWDVSASGGLTTSNIPGYRTTSTPFVSGNVLYQISQRWQFRGSETYLFSTDPFQQYTVYNGTPSFNQPNPTAYYPLATTQSNSAYADLTYQVSAHDSITFTGTESFTNISGLSSTSTPSLYNWYSWGGVVQYQHLFSPRLVAGGSYGFNAVDYGHGQSRSGIQPIQGFVTYKLASHMSVSGWVGPEHTATKNLVPIFCNLHGCYILEVHNSSWSDAFGGNFGWSGQRNSAMVSFSKGISDGGILFGIVQLYQARASYARQLTARWSMNVSALYGNNNGYATRLHAQHLRSLTGYASLARQVTPALSASFSYAYFDENQEHLYGATVPKWTDNRFQFALQYSWGHSLGR
jgi:hypothetical protein